MKTREEIKEEYAIEQGYSNWDSLLFFWIQEDIHECNNHINEVTKRYATEYGKEVQRLCAENAESIITGEGIMDHTVDKESILSEDNLPSHE